jgi:hypothetical protein
MRTRRTFRNEAVLADQVAQVPDSPLKPYRDELKDMAENGPPAKVRRLTAHTDDKTKIEEHVKNFRKAARELHMKVWVQTDPLLNHRTQLRITLLSCPQWDRQK